MEVNANKKKKLLLSFPSCQIDRNEELPGGGAAGQDASSEIFYHPAIVSLKQNCLQPKKNRSHS